MEDDISSLSAILLDAAYLIPFKAKAWIDLSERKARGEHVDSRDIRKYKTMFSG